MITHYWFCGTQMVWEADFSYEDYYGEDDDIEGMIANLSCPNEKYGATADFYLKEERDDD